METSRKVSPGIVLGLTLLIMVAAVFVVAFVVASQPRAATPANAAPDVETVVAALLADADAVRGADLVVEKQCVNCHIYAAGMAAPGWNGLADRAGERQPPLSAAAYLYESITDPAAYVVEGYSPSMPVNFNDTLTPQELGDIIAHLLTLRSSS